MAETQIIPKILNREKLIIPSILCPDGMYEAMLLCWRLGACMSKHIIINDDYIEQTRNRVPALMTCWA